MALRLLVADSAEEKDAAREVEAQVFLQAFGNTPEVMQQEYGPYDDRSRFVTVIDDSTGRAVGTARIILPDATGEVKTLTDVAGAPWHLAGRDGLRAAGLAGSPVWDSATLAVDPRHRRNAAGAEVTLALVHGLWRHTRLSDIRGAVTILDDHVLRAAGLSGSPVWDSATLAVHPRHRRNATGAEVTLALVHGLWRYTRLSGVRGAVTVLDDHVLASVQELGVPWTPMVGATSQSYLGSPASTPCLLLIESFAESIRARRPELAPCLVDGTFRSIALDPADLLPGRGASVPEIAASSLPSPAMAPRSGWRPPAYRRSHVSSGSPTTTAGAGHGSTA